MNEQQFQALVQYIDARIEEKLRAAGGWNALEETIRTRALRVELREAFGLPGV